MSSVKVNVVLAPGVEATWVWFSWSLSAACESLCLEVQEGPLPTSWPALRLLTSGSSLQLYIHWGVGDSFVSSPSDREVKQPHLVGPDLWVTEEVAVQTAREGEVLSVVRL